MKIISASQTRQLDNYTIEQEPIASIDLMERASLTFTEWFVEAYPDKDRPIQIFCGIGNNGGDGLAVARLLHRRFYNVEVYCCQLSTKTSSDFDINLKQLLKINVIPVFTIREGFAFPEFKEGSIIIDAIFGSGLNREVEAYWAELLTYLNNQENTIVSIDIPSGLFADRATSSVSIKAHQTFSFELPKLAFLFPENQDRVGEWNFRSIGLSKDFINQLESPYHFVTPTLANALLKTRQKYDHKGTYGHALLIMGSYGKVGAAILAAKACLRTGAGLVSVHAPKCAYEILQISVPEAMVNIDSDKKYFSEYPDLAAYKAIGIGCGLDKKGNSAKALKQLLGECSVPLLLDADALNILSENQSWYELIPENSILTPHPKEFERLFGTSPNQFERNQLQREKSKKLGIFIVLKGAHSCISCPDGNCYFNSTGNPGMATAGSGDVLSGIICGLLAQGYTSFEASVLGVFLHGLAGDLAAEDLGQESMLAGDIISYLGTAFKKIRLIS